MLPNRFKKLELVAAICAASSMYAQMAAAQELPEGADIQHGDVSIHVQGTQMQVNQGTQYGIVNWDSFNVGSGHGVDFANGAGATLNRVTGVNVSHIYGDITSTGSVFLLNSNGIIIGEGGSVLTGGDFVGSTNSLSNEDFLNGGGFTLRASGSGSVTNLGKISSSGGNVLLAGYTVVNKGEISAPNGHAGLVAGTEIEILTDLSWGGGAYAVRLGERDNTVTNEGRIEAMVAELRTHNGNIYALAGNNEGLVQATAVRNEGGKVFLTADQGLVQSSGTVIAKHGEDGGEIEIHAAQVENYGGVQDVSGASGGRIAITADDFISDTVMLAQGYEGGGGTITVEAEREVLLTSAGIISVDGAVDGGEIAIDAGAGKQIHSASLSASGNIRGGRVSLWGNNIAVLGGSIDANGGPMGGEIYVGGGFQGQDIWPDQPLLATANSQSTYISENAVFNANAGFLGKGGTVVAWSDGTTQFAGVINARGGFHGGDGGVVETSGLQGLGVSGQVDASAIAAYGSDGSWLLDPKNITIANTTDSLTEFQRFVNEVSSEEVPVANTFHAGESFGSSVDISGNTVVVGTGGRLSNDYAYIFDGGVLAARLESDIANVGFGSAVAIQDDLVAVVANSDFTSVGTSSNGTPLRRAGALHVFAKGTQWQNGNASQIFKEYNPAHNDEMGGSLSSVAITKSANATHVYVGDNAYNSFVGRVYQWDFQNSAFNGTKKSFDSPVPTGQLQYGKKLAASGNLFFASTDVQFGGFNVYATNNSVGGNELLTDTIVAFAADEHNAAFVTNSQDRVKIYEFIDGAQSLGATKAFSPGTLVLKANATTTTLGLGVTISSIAIHDSTILLGASNGREPGSAIAPGRAYLFERPELGWERGCNANTVFRGCAPDRVFEPQQAFVDGQFFGSVVALGDGIAAVGAPRGAAFQGNNDNYTGEVGLFIREGSSWAKPGEAVSKPNFNLIPQAPRSATDFGGKVAADGDTYVVADRLFGLRSAQGFGALYVYENGALAARLTQDLNRGFGFSELGIGVDISGNTLAASYGRGVTIFEKGTGWKNGAGNFVAYTGINGLDSVASVSLDGNTLAVGDRAQHSAGSVSIFENSSNNWVTTLAGAATKIQSPNSAVGDGFGFSVALSGNSLLVGETRFGFAASTSTAWVFENTANDWSTATRVQLSRNGSEGLDGSKFFGAAVALDGNTAVVGFSGNTILSPSETVTTRGAYVYEKSGSWNATPAARLQVNIAGFGAAVDIENDRIAVTSLEELRTTTDRLFLFDKQGEWRDGDANLVATLRVNNNGGGDFSKLGNSVALAGNRIVSGGVNTPGLDAGIAGLRAVYEFKGPYDINSRYSFTSGPGDNMNIAASALANSLSLGTNILLQANNDISVIDPILVNNPSGNGGSLTLEAGRTILINASINSDNGAINLLAGSANANAAFRDSGEARVLIGTDASGNSATLTAGTANILINAPDRFENRTLTNNIFLFDATNPGDFLVYSNTPENTGALSPANLKNDLDVFGRDFVFYNKTFDPANTRPVEIPGGSGFVYTIQPTIEVSVGNDSITFGDTPSALLTLTGASLNGAAINAADFGISGANLSSLIDTGLSSAVTLSTGGFANAGNYVGGLTATAKTTVTSGSLFGVAVSTGAAGDLTVSKKQIRAFIDNVTRDYGTANPTFGITYTNFGDLNPGLVTGDTGADIDTPVTVTTTAVINSDASTTPYDLIAGGGQDSNYDINLFNGSLTINKADLLITGLTGVDKVYDSGLTASLSGTAAISVLAGDDVTLGGTLNPSVMFADKNVGNNKPLSVSGFVLNGTRKDNYNLIQPTSLTASITPLGLNLSGLSAVDRVYDTTANVAITGNASVTGLSGDTVSVGGVPIGLFANKNVGADKAVSVSGLSLSGTDAANYSLNTNFGLAASVTAASLQITGLVGVNRVYDGSLNASLAGNPLVTALGTDSISVAGLGNAVFADKNVADGKAITVSGFTLAGIDAQNYSLAQPTGLSANITPLDRVVLGVTAQNKVYDATTMATLMGTATLAFVPGDIVSVTDTGVASFADKNAGTAKAVTVTGFTLAGLDAANYNLLQPNGLNANITPRALTVTGLTVNDKVYDTSTSVVTTGAAVFGGVLTGDDLSIDDAALSLAFADKNAGVNKSISLSGVALGGADAGNYNQTDVGLTGTITPASLNIGSVSVSDRIYDASVNADLTGGVLQGVLGSDNVTLDASGAVGTFADKNVGANKQVSTSGYVIQGADAGNYSVTPLSLTGSILHASLNILGLDGSKTYDGLASTTLRNNGLDAVFAGDNVSLDDSGVTASYADKTAGDNKAITLAGTFNLTGIDSGNYLIVAPGPLQGNIAKLGITVNGLTIADKVYDGTTAGTIAGTGTFGGAIAGDDLSIAVGSVNVQFADKNAGVNKAVALSGVTLSGADAANYTAATPTGITATISPKELTISGISAEAKVYDRTNLATLSGTAVLNGFVVGDNLQLDDSARSASFADKNVGEDKAVTVSNINLNGLDAANYTLLAPSSIVATISKAQVLLGGFTAVDRIYNGTTELELTGTSTFDFGTLTAIPGAQEDLSLAAGAIGRLATKAAGTDKSLTIEGAELAGSDAGNYDLVLPTDLTVNIGILEVQATGLSAADKDYDANNVAELVGNATADFIAGDSVELSGAAEGAFADKNVGQNRTVTVSGLSIAGSDAANYSLIPHSPVTASIAAVDIMLSGIQANDKVYDGTLTAPLSGSFALSALAGDSVSIGGQASAEFSDKNVGTGLDVNLVGVSLAGVDSGNYNLLLPSLSASITPRTIAIDGITPVDRVYDGTTDVQFLGDASLTNVIAGDQLGFDASLLVGSFSDKNVANDKLVSVMGGGLSGADASNYLLELPGGLSASVTPKALDLTGLTAVDREYDATTTVEVSGGSLSGAIPGDDVGIDASGIIGSVADANVGTDKPVTVAGVTLTGQDRPNYILGSAADIGVNVTAKQLEIAGVTVADKFFDGNTNATVSGGNLQGVISGEDVGLVGQNTSGSFVDPEVGDAKPVVLTGFTLTGAGAGNYTLGAAPTATGNILRELALISDIIPPEVLRANSNANLEQQRAELTALADAQNDAITVTDFETGADALFQPIAAAAVNNQILSVPAEQRDEFTQSYVVAAQRLQSAQAEYATSEQQYRGSARILKNLGQAYNQAQRDIEVETALLTDIGNEIAQADAVLAELDANLAEIQTAKERLAEYTQLEQDALNTGRGAEAAQYRELQAGLQELIDQEDDVLQQRNETAAVVTDQRNLLADTQQRVSDLEQRSVQLTADMAQAESDVATSASRANSAKQQIAAADAEMEESRIAGQQAYETMAAGIAELQQQAETDLRNLEALANSTLAADTARSMAQRDAVVMGTQAGLEQANTALTAVRDTLNENLGPAAVTYAQQLADQANSPGGLSQTPDQLRDGLVASIPQLSQLQSNYDNAMNEQQASLDEATRLFSLGSLVAENLGGISGPALAQIRQQETARLNARIAALSGVDLSNVPAVDASGNEIPMVERIALGMLINQDITSAAGAINSGTASAGAAGFQGRVDSALSREFGISASQAISNPGAAAGVVAGLVPTDTDSAVDVAEQMAVASIRLNGVLRDSAMDEAAAQDPTGILTEVNNIDEASNQAFADTYGATPEDMIIGFIGAQADAARNANSPQEFLGASAAIALDGDQNPLAVSSNTDVAVGGRTALAMQDAATEQAERADKTGTLKAANDIRGAVDAEFAAVFGGSPEELALDAIEDPAAAAATLQAFGEDLLSDPSGAATEAVNIVGQGAVNAANSAMNTARDQLEYLAGPLGGVGEAMTTIADWGIDVVGGAIDFAGGLFGLDSGPSDAEVAAAEAYLAQRSAVAQMEQQQAEDQAIMAYLEKAQAIAAAKYNLAVGVEKAKDQVGNFVLNSKVTARRQQEYDVTLQATENVIENFVQSDLERQQAEAGVRVNNYSGGPEEFAARAALWSGET